MKTSDFEWMEHTDLILHKGFNRLAKSMGISKDELVYELCWFAVEDADFAQTAVTACAEANRKNRESKLFGIGKPQNSKTKKPKK